MASFGIVPAGIYHLLSNWQRYEKDMADYSDYRAIGYRLVGLAITNACARTGYGPNQATPDPRDK